jgi:excisionase family DNA binding protein
MSSPILVPINEASALIGKCRRGIYQLIATGEIEARKSGRSTLIVYESLMRYVEGLPAAKIKPYVVKSAEAAA